MQPDTPESFPTLVVPGKPLPFELSDDALIQLKEVTSKTRETVAQSSAVEIIRR